MNSALEDYRAACARSVAAAKEKLRLADVWDLGFFSSQEACPQRDGVVRSPLREDRTPSFSVFSGGRAFDDKAREGIKGGVWEFVAFAKPDMESGEIARLLVERSGGVWPDKRDFFKDRGATLAVAPSDRAKLLREERLRQTRMERDQRDRVERQRRAARMVQPVVGRIPAWPACVAERWAEGAAYRDARPEIVVALCEKRGWPAAWSEALGALDALAFPVEARYEVGGDGARRMVAFRVEAPVLSRGAVSAMETVGVHQKFYHFEDKTSGWRFFPARPKKGAQSCSSYERALAAVAEERGIEEGESMVPPLPFVVGDVKTPRLAVIVEGQWDALTFYGALGGLDVDGSGLAGIVVFGVRGAKGTRVFLEHWLPWFRVMKPLVWLLPDNDSDKTHAAWYPPAGVAGRDPGRVYFSEQLVAAGARRVAVTLLRRGGGRKDFNDYFRAAKPSVGAMWEWMGKLKLT